MIGTIVNTAAIIVGTVVGSLLSRGIKEKYKIVEGSDMKLGATLIWEKCKKVSEDFSS